MTQHQQMHDKVALVTGAATGIGRATAVAFAREGFRLAIADTNLEGLKETEQQIKAIGGAAILIETDVADPKAVKAMVEKTMQAYNRLDYAFNNAGIEGDQNLTADCSLENWKRVIDINLNGIFYCMKYEIPEILKHEGGAIVNMSSVAGLVGFANIPAYAASKHGVIGLTKTSALEYAESGIRINAVCPGIINTEMIVRFTQGDKSALAEMEKMEPIGRLGKPEEVANTVVWLCSDAASFITGHALPVDGGYVAR
jgi:NAD(P)-dependent dehydrogenase (short-subunit alcohol dehydrogenase family)